jgi:hypothetical protein
MAYFHAGAWEAGKTKNCEKTTSLSGQSQANELVSQFRSQIDQAQTFAVTFEVPNSQRIFWECERTAGGIDCR